MNWQEPIFYLVIAIILLIGSISLIGQFGLFTIGMEKTLDVFGFGQKPHSCYLNGKSFEININDCEDYCNALHGHYGVSVMYFPDFVAYCNTEEEVSK